MDYRLFAVLAAVCFALEGAGCASESQRARRDEILMPMQTGSTIQRRVMVPTGPADVAEKPQKKKKESKRASSEPTPAPEPKPQRHEEESTTPPDRFR